MKTFLSKCPPFADFQFDCQSGDLDALTRLLRGTSGKIINLRNPFTREEKVWALPAVFTNHWFLSEIVNTRAAIIYLNGVDTPRRVWGAAADLIRETGGQLPLPARLPWPLSNLCLGLRVRGDKTTDTQLAMFCALPAAIRYLRVESFPAVWFQERVFSRRYEVTPTTGETYDVAAVTLQRRIHWVVLDSSAKDTVESTFSQCVESGTPIFAARPVLPKWQLQAYPIEFGREPRAVSW